MLAGDGSLERFGWPFTAKELFGLLRFLMRYFNVVDRRQSEEEALQSHGLPSGPSHDWRKSESVACVQLERSLRLVESWPDRMTEFVRTNQPKFNRLYREHGNNFPDLLASFVQPLRARRAP